MKRIYISLISVLCCFGAYAQSLNSTVDVSNDYLSSFASYAKSDIPMCVPDSLLQFNKDFDYTVFDNPFKGSYEFSPYSVQLKPEAGDYGVRRFYLRAGAGWHMYPVLDAVYSPELKDNNAFKFSVYQKGCGFIGNYYNEAGEKFDGNYLNLSERFGAELHYDTKKVSMRLDAAYDGVYGGVVSEPTLMHGADVKFDLATLKSEYFSYRLKLGYKLAALPGKVNNFANIEMTLEPKTKKTFRFPIDIRAQYVTGGYLAGVAPHIRMMLGPVDVNAGVKLTYWSPADGLGYFRINPDVHACFNIVRAAAIYLDVDGGQNLISANDVLHHNPLVNQAGHTWSDETIRFNLGLRGRIAGSFEYDINGGYSIFREAPLDSSIPVSATNPTVVPYVGVSLTKFNMFFANAMLSYKDERLDVDAGVHYRFTNLTGAFQVYDMPLFTGSARITYNWQRRIFVGIGAEGSADRTGPYLEQSKTHMKMPWWIDLGATAEYRITREFGVWVRGTNLLNRSIMRTPVYVEKGINVIGGISLNF